MTKRRIIIISSIVVVLLAVAGYFFYPRGEEVAAPKWTTSEITSQNITESVTATGTIEPVTLVDVGTQVSGILTTLYVDYNSVVTKGQVIAELDKSNLLLTRNSSKNSVASARSKYTYEMANYKRVKALFDKGLVAESDHDLALYDYESAFNNYEVAKNNLEVAETNLGYATIYSPIDGVVLSRSVEEGQTVASSYSTPTLFTIAADLTDLRVIVDVDEADIGNVKEGQRATFSVDAFPLLTFEGVVTQVRQEGIEESNVVTYEVVISAANPDLKLKPGLTANVEIFTLDMMCDNVVTAAALQFTPPTPDESTEAQMPQGARPGMNNKKRPSAPTTGEGTIWILNEEEHLEPRRVEIGVSNGVLTQVSGKDIKPGMQVVTGEEVQSIARMGGSGSKSPFVQQRGGPRR